MSTFASHDGVLEALALFLMPSKILIFLQGRFAGLVGRLDLLSRYPNDRHSPPPITRFSKKYDAVRVKTSPLLEIALVLVRFNHVASVIVNTNHGIMGAAAMLGVADSVADCIRPIVPQPTEWQHIGN